MSDSPLRFTVCPHAVDLTLRDCAMCNNKLRAERDELLAALTELLAAGTQISEGSGDDGADILRYDAAWAAAERLAGDKTE